MPRVPELPMDADLRVAAGAARARWRDDEEHWAVAALEQWRHTRTLADLARDHLHRGDDVMVRWPGATVAVTGQVIGVAGDALALGTFAGRVDVSLRAGVEVTWRVVDHAPRGSDRSEPLGSFRARLLELEADGRELDVGLADDVVRGTLRVGRDHVQVVSPDATWVVALSAVRWVREPARG